MYAVDVLSGDPPGSLARRVHPQGAARGQNFKLPPIRHAPEIVLNMASNKSPSLRPLPCPFSVWVLLQFDVAPPAR